MRRVGKVVDILVDPRQSPIADPLVRWWRIIDLFMRRRPRYRLHVAIGVACALTATFLLRDDLAHFVLPAGAPSASVAKAIGTPLPPIAEPASSADAGKKADQPKLAFDVVRIDPEGVSVFAGHAPPNANVTILADGQVVAAAKADETGAWAAVTEREFVPGERELSLRAEAAEGGAVREGRRVRLAIAPTPRSMAPASTQDTAPAHAIPAPVTFVYNETTFTNEGRKAAALLAEHLISRRSEVVSLSGHADERGSDQYNIELSRQRLEVVAGYLRDHGFVGKLDLIPKGKSEPYAGADRHTLPREAAFQLDRRVELRLAR